MTNKRIIAIVPILCACLLALPACAQWQGGRVTKQIEMRLPAGYGLNPLEVWRGALHVLTLSPLGSLDIAGGLVADGALSVGGGYGDTGCTIGTDGAISTDGAIIGGSTFTLSRTLASQTLENVQATIGLTTDSTFLTGSDITYSGARGSSALKVLGTYSGVGGGYSNIYSNVATSGAQTASGAGVIGVKSVTTNTAAMADGYVYGGQFVAKHSHATSKMSAQAALIGLEGWSYISGAAPAGTVIGGNFGLHHEGTTAFDAGAVLRGVQIFCDIGSGASNPSEATGLCIWNQAGAWDNAIKVVKSDAGFAQDIVLQNDEVISNATDGTIKTTGKLAVEGTVTSGTVGAGGVAGGIVVRDGENPGTTTFEVESTGAVTAASSIVGADIVAKGTLTTGSVGADGVPGGLIVRDGNDPGATTFEVDSAGVVNAAGTITGADIVAVGTLTTGSVGADGVPGGLILKDGENPGATTFEVDSSGMIQALAGLGPRTLVVDADGGGKYATLQSAHDAIADAAADKRYTVYALPGAEDQAYTPKDHVDVAFHSSLPANAFSRDCGDPFRFVGGEYETPTKDCLVYDFGDRSEADWNTMLATARAKETKAEFVQYLMDAEDTLLIFAHPTLSNGEPVSTDMLVNWRATQARQESALYGFEVTAGGYNLSFVPTALVDHANLAITAASHLRTLQYTMVATTDAHYKPGYGLFAHTKAYIPVKPYGDDRGLREGTYAEARQALKTAFEGRNIVCYAASSEAYALWIHGIKITQASLSETARADDTLTISLDGLGQAAKVRLDWYGRNPSNNAAMVTALNAAYGTGSEEEPQAGTIWDWLTNGMATTKTMVKTSAAAAQEGWTLQLPADNATYFPQHLCVVFAVITLLDADDNARGKILLQFWAVTKEVDGVFIAATAPYKTIDNTGAEPTHESYTMELHSHSTKSDGALTPDALREYYMWWPHSYDAVTITDHNKTTRLGWTIGPSDVSSYLDKPAPGGRVVRAKGDATPGVVGIASDGASGMVGCSRRSTEPDPDVYNKQSGLFGYGKLVPGVIGRGEDGPGLVGHGMGTPTATRDTSGVRARSNQGNALSATTESQQTRTMYGFDGAQYTGPAGVYSELGYVGPYHLICRTAGKTSGAGLAQNKVAQIDSSGNATFETVKAKTLTVDTLDVAMMPINPKAYVYETEFDEAGAAFPVALADTTLAKAYWSSTAGTITLKEVTHGAIELATAATAETIADLNWRGTAADCTNYAIRLDARLLVDDVTTGSLVTVGWYKDADEYALITYDSSAGAYDCVWNKGEGEQSGGEWFTGPGEGVYDVGYIEISPDGSVKFNTESAGWEIAAPAGSVNVGAIYKPYFCVKTTTDATRTLQLDYVAMRQAGK